jgi:hypothetical protein
MLVKTWLPRVTEVDDVVDVDGCAAGDPATAVITLETSAAADAIIVEVELDAADVALVAPVV